MNPKLRRIVYPALGVWLCLLLVGLAYLQSRDEDAPSGSVDVERQLAEETQLGASEQARQQSEAKLIGQVRGTAKVGKPAPQFKLAGENGTVSLKSFRGKPVLVEFFASWCPHCRAMAPVFSKVMRKRDDVGYLMVAAAREDHGDVLKWREDFLDKPMPGKVAFDDTLDVARAYGVEGYPTVVLIDADGVVTDKTSGEMSEEQLTQLLDSVTAR